MSVVLTTSVDMTEEEARAATEQIRQAGDDLAVTLWRFHEARGWAAMGYASFTAWARQELEKTDRMGRYLLTVGRVKAVLHDASGGKTFPRLSGAKAHDLAPRLEEVAAAVAADPEHAQDVIDAVVEEVRSEEEPEDVEGGSAPLDAYEGEEDGEQPGSEDSDLNSVAPGAQPSEPDDTTPRAADIAVEWIDGTMDVFAADGVTEAMWRELEAFCRTQYDEAPPARQDFPAWTPPPVNTHGAPPASDLEAVRRTLEAHPNEPLTTTEVAKFAHVSPPRTADALRWLESNEMDVVQKGRCYLLRKVTA